MPVQTKTKQQARSLRDTLLAMADANLLEAIDSWLLDLEQDEFETADKYRLALGYRVRSEVTGCIYDSFLSFDENESENEASEYQDEEGIEFTFVTPEADTLRKALSNLSLRKFYQHWLHTHGGVREISRSAEATEEEEADLEPEDNFSDTELRNLMRANERYLNFSILLLNKLLSNELLAGLKRYNCTLTLIEDDKIEGYCLYFVSSQRDLKVLSRVRRLLNRWQEKGHLEWHGSKIKPLKRPHTSKSGRKTKQTRKTKIQG
jgi:hypothetical protein